MLRFGLPTVPGRGLRLRALLRRPAVALPRRERPTTPACTRSRSSSPGSSSSPCARSSTRGRRSRTRSRTTPRRRASTPASRPTTCCSPALVVAGLALLGRWVVRIFAAPEFFAAHEALPWVALGWALYGLFLVLVAMAGPRAGHGPQRARRAVRAGGQRRAAGAARAAARDRRRRAGAGRRLRRDARRDVGADPQPVPGRVRVGPPGAASWSSSGGLTAAGELLLPTDGVAGFVTPRAGAGRDPARAVRRALLPARASCAPPAACSDARQGLQPPVELLGGLGAGPSPRRGKSVA